MQRNAAIEWFWKIHPRVYRWTGGRIGGRLTGLPVLLLTTRGRRSGRERTVALTYFDKAAAPVVVASVLGEPKHPAWWLNLEANPDATLQIGAERQPVRAREAEGDEREAIWKQLIATSPAYEETRLRSERRFPVVLLEPRD